LSAGNYSLTNAVLRTNILFAVPTDLTTNIYEIADLAISGFNTYNYTPGVRSLVQGNGITLSATTGNITITGTGTIIITRKGNFAAAVDLEADFSNLEMGMDQYNEKLWWKMRFAVTHRITCQPASTTCSA
jgi:hypothetical protein